VTPDSDGNRLRSRNGTVEAGIRNPRALQRAVAIGVVSDTAGEDAELGELRELLRTAGVATTGWMVQGRTEPDPDRYFGRGKLDQLKQEIKRSGANLVACDDELAPRQERNLESALGVPVIDRTAVILDIFADHAHSAAGKLQVELAQLEYNLARMRGLWTHLERLGAGRMDGGIGTRGPGESQIETDRRLARDRISALRRELRVVERSRETMRAERDRSAIPTVALAGYTNAGKSTLLNAITGAGVGVGGRLFQTLDPTTRSYEHAGRKYLLTDTVGFIRKLPHQLVDAFKATLEETTLADLIVHVVDGSEAAPSRAAAMRAVDSVLEEIGAGDTPRVLAFNKLDLISGEERRDLLVGSRDAIGISAATGAGVEALLDAIEEAFAATLEPMELLIPYDHGSVLSELHALAGQIDRTDREDGVAVRARVPRSHSHRFSRYSTGGVGDATAA
jgi:GTPase